MMRGGSRIVRGIGVQGRSGTPGIIETLHEPLSVAAIHADGDRCFVLPEGHGGDQRQGRIPANLRLPRDAERAGGGKPDPNAGKTAGSEGYEYPLRPTAIGQFGYHRDKTFGMAPAENFVPLRDKVPAIEQRDRTRFSRSLYRQCSHPLPFSAASAVRSSQAIVLNLSNSGRGLRSKIVDLSP